MSATPTPAAANSEKARARAETLLADAGGVSALDLPYIGASLLRQTRPGAIEGHLYQPLICAVLEGEKRVQAGDLSIACPRGHIIQVSHDLPVMSCITGASPEAPYLAFILPLDLSLLRSFFDQLPDTPPDDGPDDALQVQPAEPALLDAVARLLELAPDAPATPVLAPILLREIHARLLFSPHGASLRRFLWRNDPANQIARAIAVIRGSVDQPPGITELARLAGMSRSSFHARFKAVTGLSPGQYQKDIRLLSAQRLLTERDLPIASVAFEVGYESPAQFSRDYARKFGRAPREDRRASLLQAAP